MFRWPFWAKELRSSCFDWSSTVWCASDRNNVEIKNSDVEGVFRLDV
ncbi:hypothetical protein A1F94_007537 [Pyrenophora tritici-repentis]|uniref:Uncharacterized protein n=1 Tax=Pyrenophora tritici-repentis TaxID=45151 RepID=A0A922NGH2_9PLEO|nr:hypothetical protein A1F99_094720 [Pyrenophora tritici-repentis]KAG9381883.1 hypothetical protein A1F94_007537 [Pyrenophora tritici-repentis]KAI1515496.1 hypothetical protein Ptr86124_005497 [Pyrenophora tritici-repentis]KAI1664379.1 hypothetical protein L13192_11563 [Pyrenophora tritici-repentis]KAI1678480.1 hypothetical protein KJE20_12088 [Pyrenophora tritici-repentis]